MQLRLLPLQAGVDVRQTKAADDELADDFVNLKAGHEYSKGARV